MCKLFEEWSEEIKEYCAKHNLNFDILKSMLISWNNTTVMFSYCVPSDSDDGLYDDTPSPVILIVQKTEKGNLIFEHTEYTDLYLKKVV